MASGSTVNKTTRSEGGGSLGAGDARGSGKESGTVLGGHEHTGNPGVLGKVVKTTSRTGGSDFGSTTGESLSGSGAISIPVVCAAEAYASSRNIVKNGLESGETGKSHFLHLFEDGLGPGVGVADTTSIVNGRLARGNSSSVGETLSDSDNHDMVTGSGGRGVDSASGSCGNATRELSVSGLVSVGEDSVSHGVGRSVIDDDEVEHVSGIDGVGVEEVSRLDERSSDGTVGLSTRGRGGSVGGGQCGESIGGSLSGSPFGSVGVVTRSQTFGPSKGSEATSHSLNDSVRGGNATSGEDIDVVYSSVGRVLSHGPFVSGLPGSMVRVESNGVSGSCVGGSHSINTVEHLDEGSVNTRLTEGLSHSFSSRESSDDESSSEEFHF